MWRLVYEQTVCCNDKGNTETVSIFTFVAKATTLKQDTLDACWAWSRTFQEEAKYDSEQVVHSKKVGSFDPFWLPQFLHTIREYH